MISTNPSLKEQNVLSFELDFNDNEVYQKWADVSLSCVENIVTCTTLLNQNMAKKPDYIMKTNTLAF
jgi:hypothetical protein